MVSRNDRIFFINDTATTEIYTLSLHDALPIYRARGYAHARPDAKKRPGRRWAVRVVQSTSCFEARCCRRSRDRKSTRLNSSHSQISYAVFCLKKKPQCAQTHNIT